MAGKNNTDFLVAITIPELKQMTQLADEIKRVQDLSSKGATFKIGVDASELNNIDRIIQEKVNAAMGRARANAPAQPSTKNNNQTELTGLTSMLAELKSTITLLGTAIREMPKGGHGTGGAGIETNLGGNASIDTDALTKALRRNNNRLNKAFEKAGEQIAERLAASIAQIPEMLNLDTLLPKLQAKAQEKALGLSGPLSVKQAQENYSNPRVAEQDFALYNASRDRIRAQIAAVTRENEQRVKQREAQSKQTARAEAELNRQVRNYPEAQKQVNAIVEATPEFAELRKIQERVMQMAGPQDTRNARQKASDRNRISELEKAIAATRNAAYDQARAQIRGQLQETVITKDVTGQTKKSYGKVNLGELGGVRNVVDLREASRQSQALKTRLAGIAKSEQQYDEDNNPMSDKETLDFFRGNPILGKFLQHVRGPQSAQKALDKFGGFKTRISDALAMANVYGPQRYIGPPTLEGRVISPLEANQVALRTPEQILSAGGALTAQEKAYNEYIRYSGPSNLGQFHEYGGAEVTTLRALQRHFGAMSREATSEEAVKKLRARELAAAQAEHLGGEYWEPGSKNLPFPGFKVPQSLMANVATDNPFIRGEHLTATGREMWNQLQGLHANMGGLPAGRLDIPYGTAFGFGGGAGGAGGGGVNDMAAALKHLGDTNLGEIAAHLGEMAVAFGDIQKSLSNTPAVTRTFERREREALLGQAATRREGLAHTLATEGVRLAQGRSAAQLDVVGARGEISAANNENKLAVERQRTVREQYKNERARQRSEMQRLGLGGPGGAFSTPEEIQIALAKFGTNPNVARTPEAALAELKRTISEAARLQNVIPRTERRLLKANTEGRPVAGLQRRLLYQNEDLDDAQFRALQISAELQGSLPGHFRGFQEPVQQYRGMVAQRLAEQDQFTKYRSQERKFAKMVGERETLRTRFQETVDAAMRGEGVAGLPEAENLRLQHLETVTAPGSAQHAALFGVPGITGAREIMAQKGMSEPADFVRKNKARIADEQAIANGILHQAQATVTATEAIRKQGTMVDFVFGKLKSIATYAGLGYVLYGFTSALGRAVSEATQLESIFAHIQGVLAGHSMSERLEIKKGVLDAAIEYGVAVKDAANIAQTFAQTGIPGKEVIQETRAALAGVQGAGLDPNQGVQLLIATRNLSGGLVKGDEILDRIARIEANYAVTAPDLAAAIQRTGAVATQFQPKRLGSVDAFDTVIGSVTKIVESTRMTGDAAATALRFMIARLASPQVEQKLQKQFGIRLATEEGGTELRPLSDIIGEVAAKYKELKAPGPNGESRSIQAAQLLTTFAGARQIVPAAALLDKWDEALKISTESSRAFGDTQRRVAIQMDTWAARMDQFHNALVKFIDSFIDKTGILGGGKAGLGLGARWLNSASEHPSATLLGTTAALTAGFGVAAIPNWIKRWGAVPQAERGWFGQLFGSIPDVVRGTAVPGTVIPATGATVGGPKRLLQAFGGVQGAGSGIGVRIAGAIAEVPEKSLTGGILANITSLSKFAGFLFEFLGIVGILGSIIGVVLEIWHGHQAQVDLLAKRYAPESVDRATLEQSAPFQAFKASAEQFRTTPTDLLQKITDANQQAQEATNTQLGGGLYTEGPNRRTDRRENEVFQREFVSRLEGALPAFKELPDAATKTAAAMQLLKDALIQVDGVAGTLQAQLLAKMKEEQDRTADLFRNAGQEQNDKGFWLDKKIFKDKASAYKEIYSSAYGNESVEHRFLDPTKGPGLAYTGALASAYHARYDQPDTEEQRRSDYKAILNGIAPNLGGAFENATALDKNGASVSFMHMVDGLVKSGSTLGQALDEVAMKTLEFGKDMTTAERANIQKNRDALVEGAAHRMAGTFKTGDWEQAARNMLEGKGPGVGGSLFQNLRTWSESEARTKLIEAFSKIKDPRAAQFAATLDTENQEASRGAGKAALPQNATGPFRDRLLDVITRFGAQREENLATKDRLGGIIGFDFEEAQRQNARGFAQGIEGSVAQTRGDLVRAYEGLQAHRNLVADLAQQKGLLADQVTETGGNFYGPAGSLIRAGALEGDDENDPERLKDRLESAKLAFQKIHDKSAVFENMPNEYQQQVTSLLGGPGKNESPEEFFKRAVSTLDGLRELAKKNADEAEREYFAREKILKAGERESAILKDRLQATQALSQYHRQAELSRTATLGLPGEDLMQAVDDLRQRAIENQAGIGLEGESDRAALGRRHAAGLIGDRELTFQRNESILEELRKRRVAEETDNLSQEKLITDRQLELDKARDVAADATSKEAQQGLRSAFEDGWKGFSGKPGIVAARLFEPLFATLQKRFGDNFLDSLIGPHGLFGDQLNKIFDSGAVQEYDLILRAHIEGGQEVAKSIEQALGSLRDLAGMPDVGSISSTQPVDLGKAVASALPGPNTEMINRALANLPAAAPLLGPGLDIGRATAATLPQANLGAFALRTGWNNLKDIAKGAFGIGGTGHGAGTYGVVAAGSSGSWGAEGTGVIQAAKDYAKLQFPGAGNLSGLMPEAKDAASRFLAEANRQGMNVHVGQTFRTQAQQDKLWAQGRAFVNGKWIDTDKTKQVTWTQNSQHTQHSAFDFVIPGGTEADYRKAQALARQFGLDNPALEKGDLGHLQLGKITWSSGQLPGRNLKAFGTTPYANVQTQGERVDSLVSSFFGGGKGGGPADTGLQLTPSAAVNLDLAGASVQAGSLFPGGTFSAGDNAALSKILEDNPTWDMTQAEAKLAQDQKIHAQQIHQLENAAGSWAGTFIGGGLNSDRGLLGIRTGKSKGNNFGSEGAALGAALGSFIPIPFLGPLIGGVAGGLLGGLISKGSQHSLEYSALEKIDRNTAETVTEIKNQTSLLSLSNRLLNVPAGFVVPKYDIGGGGGLSGGVFAQNHFSGDVHVHVNGASDPATTASAVVAKLRSDMRTQGTFVTSRTVAPR